MFLSVFNENKAIWAFLFLSRIPYSRSSAYRRTKQFLSCSIFDLSGIGRQSKPPLGSLLGLSGNSSPVLGILITNNVQEEIKQKIWIIWSLAYSAYLKGTSRTENTLKKKKSLACLQTGKCCKKDQRWAMILIFFKYIYLCLRKKCWTHTHTHKMD